MFARDVSNNQWERIGDTDPRNDIESTFRWVNHDGEYDYAYSPFEIDGTLVVNGTFEVFD